MNDEPKPDDIYQELERRALFELPEEEEEEVDVVSALKSDAGEPVAAARDVSLGGYIDVHQRVPAFEGIDGQPYTVDVDIEQTEDPDRPFVAFLVFIRWAATGAGIMDHTESRDIATGRTAEEARNAAMELSLYEVKTELDAAIARHREALGE